MSFHPRYPTKIHKLRLPTAKHSSGTANAQTFLFALVPRRAFWEWHNGHSRMLSLSFYCLRTQLYLNQIEIQEADYGSTLDYRSYTLHCEQHLQSQYQHLHFRRHGSGCARWSWSLPAGARLTKTDARDRKPKTCINLVQTEWQSH